MFRRFYQPKKKRKKKNQMRIWIVRLQVAADQKPKKQKIMRAHTDTARPTSHGLRSVRAGHDSQEQKGRLRQTGGLLGVNQCCGPHKWRVKMHGPIVERLRNGTRNRNPGQFLVKAGFGHE